MPNHVTHRVVVRGPKRSLDAFVHRCITVDKPSGEHKLDFNAIVPMPEVLRDTNSPAPVEAAYALTQDVAWRRKAQPMLEAWGVAHLTPAELHAWFGAQRPDALADAAKMLAAFKATGFTDWYEWSVRKWGTKWNSYSFEWVDEVTPTGNGQARCEFTFQTAWSVPEPVLYKLSRRYPSLSFYVVSFDEGWNFAFEATFRGGEIEAGMGECVATAQLYEQVYGEPPEQDEDEASDADTPEVTT